MHAEGRIVGTVKPVHDINTGHSKKQFFGKSSIEGDDRVRMPKFFPSVRNASTSICIIGEFCSIICCFHVHSPISF